MQCVDGPLVNELQEVLHAWEDYFYELLNPKPSPKLQTTVHSIENLHLCL